MIEIRKRLKEILEEKGIHQNKIAEVCGKSSGWISQLLDYEKYKNQNVMIQDLLKIVEYLEIDISELLPVPKKIDIEKMSFIDLIRYIINQEIERYINEKGLLKKANE